MIINWPAILVSVLVAFVFGALWYGPILGKAWASDMGLNMDRKPDPKVMKRAFINQFIGTFLTVYVLAHSVQIWRPSVWGAGADQSDAMYGFMGALFAWIGFYIPLQLSKISWENRPWRLFFINAGHDFLNLQIIAAILTHWR